MPIQILSQGDTVRLATIEGASSAVFAAAARAEEAAQDVEGVGIVVENLPVILAASQAAEDTLALTSQTNGRLDNIEASQTTDRIIRATYAELAALPGFAGQGGEVLDTDVGTHTDPVVGGTVPNAGVYSYSTSPAGWKRIGATGVGGLTSTLSSLLGLLKTSAIYTPKVSFLEAPVLGFWYDINDLSTLWANAEGTIPAVLGGIVRRFDDKSGNGLHRIAPSDAASAILLKDELGIYCLDGRNGGAYYPLASSPLYDPISGWTLLMALAVPEGAARTFYSERSSGSSAPYMVVGTGNTTDDDHLVHNFQRNSASVTVTASNPNLACDARRRVFIFKEGGRFLDAIVDGKPGINVATTGTLALNQSAIGGNYRGTGATQTMAGRIYEIVGFRKVLPARDVAVLTSYLNKKISKDANPAWSSLAQWLKGGTSGKKVIFSGDSTTAVATHLFDALGRATQPGEALAGVTVLNRGEDARGVADFVAGVGTYPLSSIIAEQANLYVLCWGINHVRTGATTEAALRDLLVQAVTAIRAGVPTADIVLWGPNALISSNQTSHNWVVPTTSGQAYSDILYRVYESLRGMWPNVAVVQKQDILGRISPATIAENPYMLDELHPNELGRKMSAGQIIDAIRGLLP